MKALYYDSIDSTNNEAKRLIHACELTEASYLLAREQTAGRGSRAKNRDRRWISPRDAGLYLTVVEFPKHQNISSVTDLTLAAGVACAESILAATSINVGLKPINDLYVDGCKLGGILTETIISGEVVEAVITGVGINVRRADRSSPEDAVPPVCLEEVMPEDRFRVLDVEALVAGLVVNLQRWIGVAVAGQSSQVREAWEAQKIPGSILPPP